MFFDARTAMIALPMNHRYQSGAEAAAVQTLRDCWTQWNCAQRLDCVRLQRRSSHPPTALQVYGFKARKWFWGTLILMAIVACLHAGETNTENLNLVIGLLVPPEEPGAASLRDGATLGVEMANQ